MVGATVGAAGVTGFVVRRVACPWWSVAWAVPWVVVGVQTLRSVGTDLADPHAVGDRLGRDLLGPLNWPALPSGGAVGPPVVVITVDTLRADDARAMGAWRRLADRGAWWPAAQSTSSWTLPAMGSMLTGRMPSEHGAGCLTIGFCQGLDPDVPTLPEALSAAGYATVGITANPWAGRHNGFGRGFDRFHDLGTDRPNGLMLSGEALLGEHPQDASTVVDLALASLDALADTPSFLLWVHLIDPHLPYVHADEAWLRSLGVEALRNANIVSDEAQADIRDAYRGEIAHTDRQLIRLIEGLAEHGVLDRGYVVLTSDHGEEFWEHGGVEHGHSHHREVVEVPLVVVGPSVRPGRRATTASVLDVVPTVLAGLGHPIDDLAGRDLAVGLPPDRIAPAEGNLHHRRACSATDALVRVIVEDCDGPSQRVDAFDRVVDPDEHRPFDLPPDHPVRRTAEAIGAPIPRAATGQATDALRALGYVQ